LLSLAAEIDLQVVAEIVHAVEMGVSAKGREFFRREGAAPVDGLLIIAGRFELYEADNRIDDLIATLLEITKAALCLLASGFEGTVTIFFCHWLRLCQPSVDDPMLRGLAPR
jgi:hypothetical protein